MRNPAQAFRPESGSIPDGPGCYLFRDRRGRVMYVGKAKSLRQRVSSYFQSWQQIAPRTQAMLEAAASVEWIVVDNEVEALHLEYNLIKQHRPRYNVRYRDDKSYPYLVLTTSEEVPRARVLRNPRDPADRRFGPFAHAYAIRDTLDLLLRVFPVRSCSQGVYDRARRAGRPCLYYHIGRCAAPCVGHVGIAEHRELVDQLAAFLDGDTAPTLQRIESEMRAAADEFNFEAAARLRDQLFAARTVLEKQQMVSSRREDLDAVDLVEDDLEAAVQVFFVRRGRVVGRKGWTVDKVEQLSTAELLTSFLLELYEDRPDEVPPLILLPEEPTDAEALAELLVTLRQQARVQRPGRGRPPSVVRLRVPQRGEKRALLETVRQNAQEAFQRHRLRRAQDFNARSQALRELQAALGLEDAPLRIECFDISHLGGSEVVGSMVVFEDGLPKKSDYRRFKVRVDRNDDYAALHEVVRRRLLRYIHEQSEPVGERGSRRFAYPPNLLLVDGGPGQLSAALQAIEELGVEGIDSAALAKRFEELHVPGRSTPVVLPRGSDALFLLQRIRDEAHRFAITYQRQRRTAAVTRSALDDVPGVGPARRRALLRRFGSLRALRAATVEELMEVPGVSRTIATAVREHLGAEEATA
ncbi:MAG TPA: excinuclease ABC subunit UvrC [Nitriliruptorales bacterium]|nr:excinuclease ABC subunit UvrC [Nitriliruptorales bacterium]